MSTYSEMIERARKEHQDVMDYHATNATRFECVVHEIEERGVEITYLRASNLSLILCVNGTKQTLNKVWAALRTQGFTTTSPRPEEKATSWDGHFYVLNTEGERIAGDPTVFFMFASTTCKRVQTGVEMVERPVYETVCDES